MGDLRDLIEVYRAIDEAVERDPELRSVVEPFIAAYRDAGQPGGFDGTPGWASRAEHLLLGRPIGEPHVEVDVDGALDRLAQASPRGRMQSRILLALAVLPRVRPEYAEGGGKHDLYISSLESLALDRSRDNAIELYRRVTDDGLFGSIESWTDMVRVITGQSAADAGGQEIAVRSLTNQPPPCTGIIVMEENARRRPGEPPDPDPVARLETFICVAGLTDEQAGTLLDPLHWPQCAELYCDMTTCGPAQGELGTRNGVCYLEDLSPDCSDPEIEHMKVCLVFWRQVLPSGAIKLGYDLCKDEDGCSCMAQDNGKVEVDHGNLMAQKQPDGSWCFSGTKYVRFTGIIDGGAVAMVACVTGYGSQAEDYLYTCFADDNGGVGPEPVTHEHPPIDDCEGDDDDGDDDGDDGSTGGQSGGQSGGGGGTVPTGGDNQDPGDDTKGSAPMSDLNQFIDQVTTWAQGRMTAYAQAAQTSMNKVVMQEYTGDDLSADLNAAFALWAEDLATFVKMLPIPPTPDPNDP